ncbi:hypothetical protein AAFF_G00351420 [Aldrovandia affinis]|uniref:Uncharacterized protein n=1 Tax=Aldrovandia affinis TaxID=143900 RepID=A0AAD7SIP9_9TELE|nr:hypothetical protein AAFF_G00351420 [Aldrovandia affinis]
MGIPPLLIDGHRETRVNAGSPLIVGSCLPGCRGQVVGEDDEGNALRSTMTLFWRGDDIGGDSVATQWPGLVPFRGIRAPGCGAVTENRGMN